MQAVNDGTRRRWLGTVALLLLLLLLAGCASRAPVLPPRATPVAEAATQNRVQMLIRGNDALAARLDLIDHAAQRIDFQTYLFHADTAGRLLAEALLRAADRGVHVRLLVDDMHGADNRLLKALNAHPRIEVRRYNPFRLQGGLRLLEALLNFREVGRRMHNKQLTVDGRRSIVGGRNVGDEYFGRHSDIAFADMDVLVTGPAVAELERSFEEYWQAPRSKPRGRDHAQRLAALREELVAPGPERAALLHEVDGSPYAHARLAGAAQGASCLTQVLADHPGKPDSPRPEGEVARQLALRLREAQADVLLISAYFVPGEAGTEALAAAAQRQVQVEVVTNSLASLDVPAVHAGYARYRERLLQAGVQLWETRPLRMPRHRPWHGPGESRASLHTKAYFFDRRHFFVGSFNLDPRSAVLNTEMGLLFDCPALAAPLRDAVDLALPALAYRVQLDPEGRLRWEAQQDGAVAVYTQEPKASRWRRFLVWWLRWLPIESEL